VLLLDEVEKAHPDVFNVLLQVLDDGRLTDGHGRTVDLRNTVIIMTSNLGSTHILDTGLSSEALHDRVLADVRGHFRPEFLNRIDEVVIFERLTREQLREIVDIQLARLRTRLDTQAVVLELSDAALDRLAELGFDPLYGARPLKRVIRRELEDQLARGLLAGEVAPGRTVRVGVAEDGTLTLTSVPTSDRPE